MSDFSDSLRNGDPITDFVLDMFDHVDDLHDDAIQKDDKNNEMYYQGQKDLCRIILARILQQPEIADLGSSSPTNYVRRRDIP